MHDNQRDGGVVHSDARPMLATHVCIASTYGCMGYVSCITWAARHVDEYLSRLPLPPLLVCLPCLCLVCLLCLNCHNVCKYICFSVLPVTFYLTFMPNRCIWRNAQHRRFRNIV